MASFPTTPAQNVKALSALRKRIRRRSVSHHWALLALLGVLLGWQILGQESQGQDRPATGYEPPRSGSPSSFEPSNANPGQARPAPRRAPALSWPDRPAQFVENRPQIARQSFETSLGDENFISDDPVADNFTAQPPEPLQPPGRRNPLFRDPAGNDPEVIPGRAPGGEAMPGNGPDDLFLPDDDEPFMMDPADDQPLGVVGRRIYRPAAMPGMDDFFPIDDRWRLGFPAWNRYLRSRWRSPWSASVIKGDYPLWGTGDKFTQLTGFSDTFFETRQVPNAAGRIDQHNFQQTFFLTADFFRNDGQFHPSEWLLSLTPAFRNLDNNFGASSNFGTLQQGFLDLQLAVVSDYYDTTNFRVGRQAFASDFRNFIFADTNDALRLFGTNESLRTFWNLLAFNMSQKDAFTALNTFENRQQQIAIGNIIRQDFIFSGFNALAGINYNHDTFLNTLDACWLELAGNGRIGQFGVSAAFIQAFGHDSFNPVAKRPIDINAQMAALEITRPTDWLTPRVSMLYASGDKNPGDGHGRGFDSIFDNPNFAGGGFSYLNREAINIGGTQLSNGFSFLPNLRNKNFQPSNFVNPGIALGNVGLDAVLSTRWQMQLNANYYDFVHPEAVAFKAGKAVGRHLGSEVSLGLLYRPLIVENVIVTFGTSAFDPGSGITSLNNNNQQLYTFFTALTAVY